MKKLVIDQLIFSPICIFSIFVTLSVVSKLFNQDSRFDSTEEMKDKGWKLYVAEWAVWPPAQFINFYILPTKYRVLYDNSISLLFDCYTSYVCFDTKKEKITDTNPPKGNLSDNYLANKCYKYQEKNDKESTVTKSCDKFYETR